MCGLNQVSKIVSYKIVQFYSHHDDLFMILSITKSDSDYSTAIFFKSIKNCNQLSNFRKGIIENKFLSSFRSDLKPAYKRLYGECKRKIISALMKKITS